jgi:hypothetical protein
MLEENEEDKIVRETNEEDLEQRGETRMLLNNILRRKVNSIGHIKLKVKSVTSNSQGSHAGKLEFCN